MVEAMKKERVNALREVKSLYNEFGFTTGMSKGVLGKERLER